MDDHYEIRCYASGDRAEADDAAAALVAADTLARDYADASSVRSLKRARATLEIACNGTYNGMLTRLARAGYRTTTPVRS